MGVTKDYSVRYTVWTLFIYMSWVAVGCMIYEQKHWLEWAVVRPKSGGKNCHRLQGIFQEDRTAWRTMNAKGQKVKKKKKDGKNLSVIGLCIPDHYYTAQRFL